MRGRKRQFSARGVAGDRTASGVRVIGRLAVAALALLAAVQAASGQKSEPTAIEVDGVGPLVTDPVSFRQVETYLAVNPTDPTNMIATALADSEDGGLAYVTRDGGETWKRIDGPGDPVFPGGDPTVAFGGDGRAYLATLASGFSVWRSPDGGRTWSGPTEVEGSMDRQWVAASHSSGNGNAPVYATARAGEQPEADIAVFVSEDGGRTFTERARISPDSAIINTVTDLTVTRDGTVLLPYLFFPIRGPRDVGRGRRGILRSRDEGDTWSGPHKAGVQVMSANTGGRSLHTLLGTGGTAVDESGGTFDGTVYMTWNQVVDGYLQPVLARSRDGAARGAPRCG